MSRSILFWVVAALCASATLGGASTFTHHAPMQHTSLGLRGGFGGLGSLLSKDKGGSPAAEGECTTGFAEIRKLMEGEKLSESAIRAFSSAYDALVRGDDGMILESSIKPATDLPNLAEIAASKLSEAEVKSLLEQTVVLKLNGGLGTGMGLEKAKSLLKVKGDDTFLDFIAKQVIDFKKSKGDVKSMFMNSFSTSADTKEALKEYKALISDEWEVVQNKVPKILQADNTPAKWPANPAKEWCPPGHGDLYPSLAGSGVLKRLLEKGVKYMFVSNSDNLGATLDIDLLQYFAKSEKSFIMEVCERTEADKKGGHLAIRSADGQLLLRESAQCAESDEKAFQDTTKHRFFNTNNLWIRLDKLQEVIDANNGIVPLPMIKNEKTVDPGDGSSPKVWQLETAMGAAIESFQGAGAVVVDRTRFAPVKTCADLLRVRSDAYEVTPDFRLILSAECGGKPPVVDLDSKLYKKVDGLEKMLKNGVPSLKHCSKLAVKGKVVFDKDIVFKGAIKITNPADEWVTLPSGTYQDQEITLPL